MNDDSKLLVLTGYPAAGKDTVMNALLDKLPELSSIITHTSRPPRSNEIKGKDHHFVSEEHFLELVEKGEILEYVKHGSHYKGTSRSEFEKVLKGERVIWRIDMSRTAKTREFYFDNFILTHALTLTKRTTKVLLKPDSFQEGLKRYKGRDKRSFNADEYRRRYRQDNRIWKKYRDRFPNVIINKTGKLDETVSRIIDMLS